MTTNLFIILLTILSTVSIAMTEALKKAFSNNIAANILALVDAIVVGGIGSVVAYILMGIPFTVVNITCIVCMIVAVWMGSMIGFDKIKQLILQITTKQ